MKNHTEKETNVYRLYFKHFHPDKFVGHPVHDLVSKCARLVNEYYQGDFPGTYEFIVTTGLKLKSVLEGN